MKRSHSILSILFFVSIVAGFAAQRINIPVTVQRQITGFDYTYDTNFEAAGDEPVVTAWLRTPTDAQFSTNGVTVTSRGDLEVKIEVSRSEAMAAMVRAGVPAGSVTSAYNNLTLSSLTNLYFRICYAKATNAAARLQSAP